MINALKRVALVCCLLQPAAFLAEENTPDDAEAITLPCAGGTQVEVASKSLTVEVAEDVRARRYGLMFREELGQDCGMLYVFENNDQRIFTMRNTVMPLDIAFITSTGIVAELATMEVGTGRYTSSAEAMYVLEVNAGWFKTHSVQPGSQISFKQGDALQPLASLTSD